MPCWTTRRSSALSIRAVRLCPTCGNAFGGPGWICPTCAGGPSRDEFPKFAPELDAGSEFMEPDAFERLASLEASSFWFRARNELIVSMLRRHAPAAASFLEVGCGTGFVLTGIRRAFPAMRLTGAEIHSEALRFARLRLPDAELIQMDARRIPYAAEFDVAGAFDVIEHIDEDVEVLVQMRQAVKPGGVVMISVPQHRWLWSAADDYAHHRRRYRWRELQSKMNDAGLEVVDRISFVSLLMPLLIASRLTQRRGLETYDPAGELKFPRVIDRSLEAAMRLERWLISRSIRFPWGGSLLAVGRRAAATGESET
jgi:SAM-dependent methyltransferase